MLLIAMDRASVRRIDVDGRLHVERTNISKATVNPYRGSEIPDGQALGLDPNRVYMLLRHPDELAKAAPTFNNLPVLNTHVPVCAEDHQPDLVVGSTGTDARFDGTYLVNSAVIWAGDSIEGVNSNRQKQWSCAYRYNADMTPGNFRGLHYDGIMRNIVGNHVALVVEGRAGPDVVVGDTKMLKTRTALLLSGALAGLVRPKLAQDASVDFTALLTPVTAANLDAAALAASALALTDGKLAADENLTVEDVTTAIEAVASLASDEMDEDDDKDDDKAKAKAALKAKAKAKMAGDETTLPDPVPAAPVVVALDAAAIRADVTREMNEIRAAERAVEPFIGALDSTPASAALVYKLALDAAKVDLTDVPEAAYAAMVRMLPRPGENAPSTAIAQDRATTSAVLSFRERFPNAVELKG